MNILNVIVAVVAILIVVIVQCCADAAVLMIVVKDEIKYGKSTSFVDGWWFYFQCFGAEIHTSGDLQ